MATHVYFVRHGESESNAESVHKGDGSLLTEAGHEQGKAVAERIAKIGVDALIASPVHRARETAAYISERIAVPIEENSLLVERKNPSLYQGKAFGAPEVVAIKREIFAGYAIPGHRYADEETLDDMRIRAKAALQFLIAHPAERVCVVTHGMFLRVLFCAAFNPDFPGSDFQNAINGLATSNTGVSYLRYEVPWADLGGEKRWRIISWNDSAHLG